MVCPEQGRQATPGEQVAFRNRMHQATGADDPPEDVILDGNQWDPCEDLVHAGNLCCGGNRRTDLLFGPAVTFDRAAYDLEGGTPQSRAAGSKSSPTQVTLSACCSWSGSAIASRKSR
jgi:hypothetical protein